LEQLICSSWSNAFVLVYFLADFNTIIAHEHIGAHSPSRLPMQDFQDWSDNNNLVHISTRWDEFTWTNGKRGPNHTKSRLDISICNQIWLDKLLATHSLGIGQIIFLSWWSFKIMIAGLLHNLSLWRCGLIIECEYVNFACWNTPVVGYPMFILSQKWKLLKYITNPYQIAEHMVNYYWSIPCTNFAILEEANFVAEVIPNLIGDNINTILTLIPSKWCQR